MSFYRCIFHCIHFWYKYLVQKDSNLQISPTLSVCLLRMWFVVSILLRMFFLANSVQSFSRLFPLHDREFMATEKQTMMIKQEPLFENRWKGCPSRVSFVHSFRILLCWLWIFFFLLFFWSPYCSHLTCVIFTLVANLGQVPILCCFDGYGSGCVCGACLPDNASRCNLSSDLKRNSRVKTSWCESERGLAADHVVAWECHPRFFRLRLQCGTVTVEQLPLYRNGFTVARMFKLQASFHTKTQRTHFVTVEHRQVQNRPKESPVSSRMVYRVWCHMVRCMVYGVWCIVYGVWCIVYSIWCMVYGV